jgi:hypothetical protein
VTVTAGLFTWRAGQLGSAAAFEDRQAVGQTIRQQEQEVEAGVRAVNDAVAYVAYVADYAEAAALDDLADELAGQGADALATNTADDARALRGSASTLAGAAGVFGRQTLLSSIVSSSTSPLPFDLDEQLVRLRAEASTGISSPGDLDPERWAAQADDTRRRARGLRVGTLLLLVAVLALTVAEVALRRATRLTGLAIGLTLFVAVSAVTISTVY